MNIEIQSITIELPWWLVLMIAATVASVLKGKLKTIVKQIKNLAKHD